MHKATNKGVVNDRHEALIALALARSASAAAGGGSVLVLQPGGPGGVDIFQTWNALQIAASLTPGVPRTTLFDNRFGQCEITDGTWNVDAWTFQGQSGANPTVLCAAGAVLVFNTLILETCDLQGGPTTAITVTSPVSMILRAGSSFEGSAAAPLVHQVVSPNIPNFVAICDEVSGIGDGVNQAIVIDAGSGEMAAQLFGFSFLLNNAIGGGGQKFVNYDAGSFASPTAATGPVTFVLIDQSTQVAFTPDSPAFWPPAAQPTTDAQALNDLAAPNVVPLQKNAVAIGPSNPVLFEASANPIQHQKSGFVRVSVGMSAVVGIGGGAVTGVVLRDGTPLQTIGPLEPDAAGNIVMTASIVDTLPNNAPHFYGIQLSSGANMTVPIGSAFVSADEI